jgi:phage shock protein A
MGTVWFTCVVLIVFLLLFNRQALARILGAGRAQAGKLGRMVEEADPLALLNQAVDDGVSSIQNAKKGLENYRTLISSVQRQVESGEKEKARLEARIQAAIDSGDPNSTAHEYALILADVEEHLQINRQQLLKHKETYENFARQVEFGQAMVTAARLKATRLGLELEQSKREKEMARFAGDFSFDPNGLNSGLARAEELIYKKIDANRAAGEVAVDLSKQNIAQAADDDLERRAAAANILERFKKRPQITQE